VIHIRRINHWEYCIVGVCLKHLFSGRALAYDLDKSCDEALITTWVRARAALSYPKLPWAAR